MHRSLRPRTVAFRAIQKRSKDIAGTPQPVNISGFAAFPAELILEIVSHFSSVPIPFDGEVLDGGHYHRYATLRLLSQLCRSFRRTLLPFVWSGIEACAVTKDIYKRKKIKGSKHYAWEQRLGTELVEQLEVVTIRMPEYAAHVQTLSVVLGRFSTKKVLEELARCLTLLPNVKTLQLSLSRYSFEYECAEVFKGYKYPGIRTLAVQQTYVDVLNSCPGVKHLHLARHRSRHNQTWGDANLEGIEKLTGLIPYSLLQYLGKKMPNLMHLRVRNICSIFGLEMAHIHQLSSLSKLQVFEIQMVERKYPFEYGEQSEGVLQQMLNTVKGFMDRSPPVKGVVKRVRVLPIEPPQCEHVFG